MSELKAIDVLAKPADYSLQKMHYIDAVPGIGKTTYAIDTIIQKAKDRVVMYVAPRISLLKQTDAELEKRMPPKQRRKRVMIVNEEREVYDKPIGMRITEAVLKAKPGDVVMCTHEGFMRYDGTDRDKDIVVVFDEARKFTMHEAGVHISDSHTEVLGVIETLKRIGWLEKREEWGEFMLVKKLDGRRREAITDILKDAIRVAGGNISLDFSSKSSLRSLLDEACNPNLEVWLKEPGYGRVQREEVFRVVSPLHVFKRFRSVLMLSAFFTDSQMYHLLKRDGVELIEMPGFREADSRVKARGRFLSYGELTAKAEADTYSRVRIVPLSPGEKRWTRTSIEQAVMIPKDRLEEFKRLAVKKAGSLIAARRSWRQDDEEMLGIVKAVGGTTDIVATLIDSAARFLFRNRRLVLFNPCIALNKKDQARFRGRLFSNEEEEPVFVAVINNDEDWMRRALPEMIDRVKRPEDVLFHTIPANPHGLNHYRKFNSVAYLSAVNASPQIIRFFRMRIPDYKCDLDFAGDSAIQSITRTSVRNHDKDRETGGMIFVLVPNKHLANIVGQRMSETNNLEAWEEQREMETLATIDTKWMEEFPFVNVDELEEFQAVKGEDHARTAAENRKEAVEKWQRELGKEFVELYADYKKNHAVKLKAGLFQLSFSSRKKTKEEFRDSVRVLREVVKTLDCAENENRIMLDVKKRLIPFLVKCEEKLREIYGEEKV